MFFCSKVAVSLCATYSYIGYVLGISWVLKKGLVSVKSLKRLAPLEALDHLFHRNRDYIVTLLIMLLSKLLFGFTLSCNDSFDSTSMYVIS